MHKKLFILGPPYFYKQALKFAIPVMVQTFIQSLISLIDNFMVGGLGDIKMSAVNITNQFVFVFIVTINAFADTGGMFMAQFNGAKDAEGMQQSYRFKQLVMLFCAMLVVIFSVFFSEHILGFLVNGNRQKAEIIAEGMRYMRVILFTFIPIAFSSAIASSLRDIGHVKAVMYISLISTLVNTIGNYILIYGNFGAPRLEVVGAGYATLAARITELAILLAYIGIKKPTFYVRVSALWKISVPLFKQMLRKVGLVFAADISWVGTETIVAALYNSRGGAEVVAGMAAGWTIANIFFLIFPVIFTCIRIMIGGMLGQNKLEEARTQAHWFLSGFFIFGIGVGICEAFSVVLIPVVFTRLSPASHIITRNLIWVIALYMPLWSYLNSQFAISRAGGDALLGAWVDISVNSILFLPGMFLLTYYTNLSPVLMFGVIKLTDIIKLIIAHYQLKKERWLKNLTVQESVPLTS
ncbi:MAG: MATE family efflux transporter [Treponema sp.]